MKLMNWISSLTVLLNLRPLVRRRMLFQRMITVCGTISFALISGCFHDTENQIEHANVAFDVSPDGTQVVFSSAGGDLFLLDRAKQNVRQLTNTAAEETSPVFSPDGQSLVYAAKDENSTGKCIFVRTLDGHRVQQLTRESDFAETLPSYSPDGSKIAFARAHLHRPYSMGGWTWDNWDICVMESDGNNLRRITNKKHYNINKVLFSRNGQTIFYSAETARNTLDSTVTIFAVSADDPVMPTLVTKPKSTTKHDTWASDLALSPDGKYFVFISDRDIPFQYDLILMDRQNGEPRSLGATRISQFNQNPVITADGTEILFLAGTEWNSSSRPIFSLWSMKMNGSNAKQIANSELFTDPINWKDTP